VLNTHQRYCSLATHTMHMQPTIRVAAHLTGTNRTTLRNANIRFVRFQHYAARRAMSALRITSNKVLTPQTCASDRAFNS
jgi:hypothetical protein